MVIISTVLSRMPVLAKGEHLGLYGDHRRFNVAITRAQALVVLIGNPNTLFRDVYFRSFCEFAWKNGAYRGYKSDYPIEEIADDHQAPLSLGEGSKQRYFATDNEWRVVL